MTNGRCRMHGGNCIGLATPAGRARMIAANTKHGGFTAAKRAEQRYVGTLITRTRLLNAARRLWSCLPPEMAARLATGPAEFATPVHPSNLPFLTPQDAMPGKASPRARHQRDPGVKTRRAATCKPPPPAGRAAERLAARAERAALAPWHQAIAFARTARRAAPPAGRIAAGRKTQSAGRNAKQSLPSGTPAARPGSEPGALPAAKPADRPDAERAARPAGLPPGAAAVVQRPPPRGYRPAQRWPPPRRHGARQP